MSKVAIIGGGPAGLMAAIEASKSPNNKVVVLERNNEVCKKLLLTGSGRCNVTSALPVREMINHYYDKGNFLFSAFYQLSNQDLIQFLEENGVKTTKEKYKVFPESNKANDIRTLLVNKAKKNDVEIRTNTLVKQVELNSESKGFIIDQEIFSNVVIATGGITYKSTGSDGIGYNIARSFGHDIQKPLPALGSLKTAVYKDLQGLSLDVESLDYYIDNKLIKSERGSILFTHFGLSGPPVINLSYYATSTGNKHKIILRIFNKSELDELLRKKLKSSSAKQLINVVNQIIPNRLTKYLFNDKFLRKQAAHVSNDEVEYIKEKLTNWQVEVFDIYDYDKAMVTKGGVRLEEVNPKTMMSKQVENLFFVGEILDLVGETGGFNLQHAFSTGYVAGKTIANKGEYIYG